MNFLLSRISFYGISLSLICLLAAYLLPVFVAPITTFYHEWIMVVSLLLLVIGLSALVTTWFISPLSLALIVVASVPLLQYALGVIFFAGDALLVCCYLLAAALSIMCGQLISHTDAWRQRALMCFCTVFIALGLINSFLAVYQFFQLDGFKGLIARTEWGSRPYGNIRQPNHFATVLLMSFVAGWYVFEKHYLPRYGYYLWLFIITLGLVLAQSRTSVLAMVLLLAFYSGYRQTIVFRSSYKEWLIILLCYFFWYFLLPEIYQWQLQESSIAGTSHLRSFSLEDTGRLAIWYEAIQALMQGPLWGYGWNQISVAQVLLDSALTTVTHFRHSHNILLDLLLYNGPILGSALVLMIIFIIWRALRTCKTIEGWVVLALIGVVFTHAQLEFPVHYMYFLLPVAFLLGLQDRVNTSPLISYSAFYNIPIIAVAAVVLWISWQDYRIVSKEQLKANAELVQLFKRDIEQEQTDNILLLSQYRESLHFARTIVTTNMTKQQILDLKNVSHRHPSPYFLRQYAKACYLNECIQETERVLNVVKRLFGEEMYHRTKLEVYQNH